MSAKYGPTPRTDAVWKRTEPLIWRKAFEKMHDHAEILERDVEELREAATALLADSDRWVREGITTALPGTRSHLAREGMRAILAKHKGGEGS